MGVGLCAYIWVNRPKVDAVFCIHSPSCFLKTGSLTLNVEVINSVKTTWYTSLSLTVQGLEFCIVG